MFGKNLAFYRMKQNLGRKELAVRVGLTPQAISNYESGKRMPDMETIKKMADVLHVKVSDFIAVRNEDLVFEHAEFSKKGNLSRTKQRLVRSVVEEYFGRFFDIVEILGGDVLPDAPSIHTLPLSDDPEKSAVSLRLHLNLAVEGPVTDLSAILENKGVLVMTEEMKDVDFDGMNGTVDGRPYIIVNGFMNGARMRATLAHELVHLMFAWPDAMSGKEREAMATAVAGAFLLPATDARRELGLRRSRISNDMSSVCSEYGVSMYLLCKRARVCGIISQGAERSFYVRADELGWKTNEPERVAKETLSLFGQLVCRAVCEDEISMQKGVELLRIPVAGLLERCTFKGSAA